MKFQLEAKLIPLLKEENDGRLSAVLISKGKQSFKIEAANEINLTINNKDFIHDLAKENTKVPCTLFFDKDGNLLELIPIIQDNKKTLKTNKVGCLDRPALRFR